MLIPYTTDKIAYDKFEPQVAHFHNVVRNDNCLYLTEVQTVYLHQLWRWSQLHHRHQLRRCQLWLLISEASLIKLHHQSKLSQVAHTKVWRHCPSDQWWKWALITWNCAKCHGSSFSSSSSSSMWMTHGHTLVLRWLVISLVDIWLQLSNEIF